ncbi:MAG TPA: AbrB/MazE/SpoVT family DNA-binding domain-containing protein [Methanobacteriaceae archaeon]|nr:AbrB/MazE/SpoVT family DNA-binding domain-containing protein [Methanobacteriaceae archaeon]
MVSVTSKFQVTIPREVREDLNIQAGDRVVFVKDPSGLWVLKPLQDLMDVMIGDTSEKEEK